jgi:hypothetical protein
MHTEALPVVGSTARTWPAPKSRTSSAFVVPGITSSPSIACDDPWIFTSFFTLPSGLKVISFDGGEPVGLNVAA